MHGSGRAADEWKGRVEAIVRRYAGEGEARSRKGAICIGRAPLVAPAAFIHYLFLPAAGDWAEHLRDSLGERVPAEYTDLLGWRNGLSLFCGHLEIYGVRVGLIDRDPGVVHAFSVVDANSDEGEWLGDDEMIVGSTGRRKSFLVVDSSGGVRLRSAARRGSIETWPSIGAAVLGLAEGLDGERDWTRYKPF